MAKKSVAKKSSGVPIWLIVAVILAVTLIPLLCVLAFVLWVLLA